jgi:hypothetical protein
LPGTPWTVSVEYA